MELQNEFTVPGRPDDVFDLLLDLEQVASCMPGAVLTGQDGDEYRGRLKLKIGPIAAAYEGTVVVADVDRMARSASLKASGRELNGQGGAEATVRATVHESGGGSRVSVMSDVQIRGKAAQFGRGVLGDVAQRVMDQFAANLEARLVDGEALVTTLTTDSPASEPAGAQPGAESLDVLSIAVLPMVRKAAPVFAGFVLGLVLGLLLRRRRTNYPPQVPFGWGGPGWTPPPAAPWLATQPGHAEPQVHQ